MLLGDLAAGAVDHGPSRPAVPPAAADRLRRGRLLPGTWRTSRAEWDTGAALVAAGLGIAMIPRLAHLPAGYPIVRVPLRGDPTPSRHILTGIRRGSSQQPLIAGALATLEASARDRDPR